MIDLNEIQYRTEVFVHGTVPQVIHGETTGKRVIDRSKWSSAFMHLPWVRQAEVEGYGRELRAHVRRLVARRMIANATFQADEMEPDAKWIDYQREKARKEHEAAAWQRKHMPDNGFGGFARIMVERNRNTFLRAELEKKLKGQLVDVEQVKDEPEERDHWRNGQRPGFEKMQRESPNKGLHMTPEGFARLARIDICQESKVK